VAANGAGDQHAAAVASVLVGNSPGSPLLEVTATAMSFSLDRPALVAVTGAAEEVAVDGHPQPVWQPVVVPAGATVSVAEPTHGLRSYVALRGQLVAPRTLGSVAPDPVLGVGTRLAAGDRVEVRTDFHGLDHPHTRIPVFRLAVDRPVLRPDLAVEVTPGPEADQFGPPALAGRFEVTQESDHVGLRLVGEAPARRGDAEILSRGVPVGAVQVPPGGGVLVLLRGRLVTAGYPVAAVATSVGVDRLAQARPGDVVSFRPVSVAAAVEQVRRRAAAMEALAARAGEALRAAGV
ncbi:MAG TPA: biotin-dependent carboxyltransferase family protein, partial [Nocardioides sp.]|nr:biotin-dependent carboxyltransferase family protein [Nocardioides sp.]